MIRDFKVKLVIQIFLIILFVGITITRNGVWRDEITLWSDTTNKSPQKLRPVFNLARSYQKAEDFLMAESFYLKVAHLFPENPDIYNNLGNIYQNMGRIDEAINFYKTGLQFRETVELYFNLALAYEKKGDISSAIYYYKKAVSLNPDDEEVRERLSKLLNYKL
jgi:tetratricopeptide (TPR) repeat protein